MVFTSGHRLPTALWMLLPYNIGSIPDAADMLTGLIAIKSATSGGKDLSETLWLGGGFTVEGSVFKAEV